MNLTSSGAHSRVPVHRAFTTNLHWKSYFPFALKLLARPQQMVIHKSIVIRSLRRHLSFGGVLSLFRQLLKQTTMPQVEPRKLTYPNFFIITSLTTRSPSALFLIYLTQLLLIIFSSPSIEPEGRSGSQGKASRVGCRIQVSRRHQSLLI